MNRATVILKGFRGALIGLRWLFVIGAILTQVRFFTGPADLDVTIFARSEPGTITGKLASGAALVAGPVRMTVAVPVQSQDTELRKLAYFATMPRMLLIAAAGFVACQLMIRLLENIKRGELFAAANRRLLAGLAIVLIAVPILTAVAADGGNQAVAHYLVNHAQFDGWRLLPQVDGVTLREISVSTHGWEVTIIGALLLVLLQAFREGAALKTESELTV